MLVYDNFKRASSSKLIREIDLNSNQIETPILTINDLTLTEVQSIKVLTENKTKNIQGNIFDSLKQKK